MNKYLVAGFGSLVMTALLFSFVIELAGGIGRTTDKHGTAESRSLVVAVNAS